LRGLESDRFDVFVTGVLDGKAVPVAVGIVRAREAHSSGAAGVASEIAVKLKLIKTTKKAYLVISDVSKKIAKDIKADLVIRGTFKTPTSATPPEIEIKRFSPPPLPLPLPQTILLLIINPHSN
jgi:hypothetical protein